MGLAREKAEWEARWRERTERRNTLSSKAVAKYDSAQAATHIGSGQIMAHFTYLCLGGELTGDDDLQPHTHFGLRLLSEAPRPPVRRGLDLHEAVSSASLTVSGAHGTSFGTDALELELSNPGPTELDVTVRKGTIFEHVDWQHRQNLMVAIEYRLKVPAGAIKKKLTAFCMNLSCACSAGNPMMLTEFYFDDSQVLSSQGLVWEHFESIFKAGLGARA